MSDRATSLHLCGTEARIKLAVLIGPLDHQEVVAILEYTHSQGKAQSQDCIKDFLQGKADTRHSCTYDDNLNVNEYTALHTVN